MSCIVELKDVQRYVKNDILDTFGKGRPRKDGDSVTVFIPYNIKNRDTLFENAQDIAATLNEKYDYQLYGDVVTAEHVDTGVDIRIHPTESLATAMTVQNEMDEYKEEYGEDAYYMGDQALAEQEGGREYDSRYSFKKKTKVVPPVTDNYKDYLAFKQEQLQEVRIKIGEVNTAKTSMFGDKTLLQLEKEGKELGKVRLQIESQIEDLQREETDLMFHAIGEDLDNIDNALDDIENTDLTALADKLVFLTEFITGKDYYDQNIELPRAKISTLNNPDFNKYIAKLDAVRSKYNVNLEVFAKKIIFENPTFKQNIVDSGEYTPDDIDKMFTAKTDIWKFDKYALGIATSFADDTVIPQVIYAEFKRQHTKEFAQAELKIVALRNFLKDTALKSFDFIYSKNAEGKRDGYVINVFATKWFESVQSFQNKYKEFLKERTGGNYREAIEWLERKADLVEPRKLKVFRDIYGETYPEYFTFDEQVMDEYEKELRRKLGPKYDDYIKKMGDSLIAFENLKVEQEALGSRFRYKNIAERNVWEFTKGFYDAGNILKEVNYTAGAQSMESAHFTNFDSLVFLPKEVETVRTDQGREEIASGYYNEDFKEIMEDPEKLEYWHHIKDMSEYINQTYQTEFYGRMSYPKLKKELVQKYGEIAQNKFSMKAFQKTLGAVKGTRNAFKGIFFEQGRQKEVDGIIANYADTTFTEAKQLAETYVQQGIEAKEALALAKEVILEQYSSDINQDIGATMLLAAFHRARVKTAPSANVLENYYKTIRDANDKPREKGMARLDDFKSRVIENKTKVYRGKLGSALGKEWKALDVFAKYLSRVPIINKVVDEKTASLLTDSERQLFKSLVKVREEGPAGNSRFTLTTEDGTVYIKDAGAYFKQEETEQGTQTTSIGEAYFSKIFQEETQKKIDELGISRNLAGQIQGILKMIITAGLALNPVSGAFNRVEGKHAGMIMDMTGNYWTPGNYAYADHILSFANTLKIVDRIAPSQMHKVKELRKIRAFAEILNTLQDRKNLLQRAAEDSKFEASNLNVYQFAVENPEYKNQMAIALSVAMSTMITDKNGEETPIFDGKSLVPFDLVEGRLVLKEEFKTDANIAEWGNFTGDSVIDLSLKITHAIDSSQGNFNPLDTIMATSEIYGKAAALFMRWLPEHIYQRFGTGQGIDIITGKKRAKGRYTAAAQASPTASITHFLAMGGLSYGLLGAMTGGAIIAGSGILGYIVYKKFFQKLNGPETVKRDSAMAMDLISMFHSTLINTLNYPLDMLHAPVEILGKKMRLKDTSFETKAHEKLTDEEKGALRAMAKELSIVLTMLSLKLGMAMLMYDDEDKDKESSEYMRYAFVQNQIDKAIKSLVMYSNPIMFSEDMFRLAAAGYLEKTFKAISTIWDEGHQKKKWELYYDVLVPTPTIIKKKMWKGQAPWEDTMIWQDLPSMNGIEKPLRYVTEGYKDDLSGGEYVAKKKYTSLREEIRDDKREQLKDAGLSGDALDDAVNDYIYDVYGRKEPGDNYKETYNYFKAIHDMQK